MNNDSSPGGHPSAGDPASEPVVHSITTAAQAHSADQDARINRYLFQMSLRVVCLILVFFIHSPVRWVFGVLAVILPYIAVVMANAAGNRRGSGPKPVPLARVPLTQQGPTEKTSSPQTSSEQANQQSHKWTA